MQLCLYRIKTYYFRSEFKLFKKIVIFGLLLFFLINICFQNATGFSIAEQKYLCDISGPMDSAWPMDCHDRKHTGRSPHNVSHNPGFEKWRVETEQVQCTPVIADDGTIYSEGGYENLGDYLLAINDDGSMKWRYKTNGWVRHASPAIADDGTIFVSSWDHKLYAVNQDGTQKWRVNVGGIGADVTIGDDGTIYVGTYHDFVHGDIVAVYPNGTIKWKYATVHAVQASPAIADDGTIYAGTYAGYFYALYPNGTLKWEYKTGDHINGPASIAEDGTVYVGSYDGYLYAFYPDNGTRKWKTRIGWGTETNPSIDKDGTIYVGGEELYAINPDGTMKWAIPLGTGHSITGSSPAISADGIIIVGTRINTGQGGGDIIAVNSDGTIRWRKTISYEWIRSSPSIAEDGTIYIGSNYELPTGHGGYIHAFGEVSSNSAPGTPTISAYTSVEQGNEEYFSVYSEDPDRNPLQFYVDWGDGTNTGWTYEYGSHEINWFTHTYHVRDTYTIKAKARDNSGLESDWGYLEIEVPYTYNYPAWQWLQEHFPIFARLLNLLERFTPLL